MKKLFLILVILATMASCGSKSGQRAATVKPKSIPVPISLDDMSALLIADKGRVIGNTNIVDVVMLKLSTSSDSLIYRYNSSIGSYVFVDYK